MSMPSIRRPTLRLSLCALFALLCLLALPAFGADRVDVVRDGAGWKLQVNGSDYYVKGVVWSYTPRGENYTYNLWGESDDFIRKVLDHDFGLMKAIGVNTIRSFAMIPPRWVEYVYREYGIRTVINPLVGRYGYTIGGVWVSSVDYSDPRTREILKRDTLEIVRRYQSTPGVLMFAFGNENNYGLSWTSSEIENLPVGEQQAARARHLYTLFNEVIAEAKRIDPSRPYAIVNGDIQYIDLIAELMPDLDVLGTNVYRGPSFTDLWATVKRKLDRPVLVFEFGSDAFNAREFREDQRAQAEALYAQWKEMYSRAWGQGHEGNSLGGFVFEWRDEWWKYLQTENLDVHDRHASWSNQAYLFDWAPGQNNMNEEWFGIMALGPPNADGVHTARPRMAYFLLGDIFRMDPLRMRRDEIASGFAAIDLQRHEMVGKLRQIEQDAEERSRLLRLTGGDFRAEMVVRGLESDVDRSGENGTEYSDGQMLFLDFAFEPSARLQGQFSINLLANVADKRPFEFSYGDRGLPVTVRGRESGSDPAPGGGDGEVVLKDRERIELYDFSARYSGEHFDLEAFYHTPRYHWGHKGDLFGLLHEATDIPGMDVWNAKAPQGIELRGKGRLAGLTLVAGPEIYWGANPKAMLKYDFSVLDVDWTFIHSEDIARLGQGAAATQATERQSRATTLTGRTIFFDELQVDFGTIIAATEKIGESYDRVNGNGDVVIDEIDFADTVGFLLRLSFPVLGAPSFVSAQHAGLVADGGQYHKVYGVTDPSRLPYSGLGNKREYIAGSRIFLGGSWMLFPRLLWRDNLVGANPFIAPSVQNGILQPGTDPRNRDEDPFAVLGNREARSGELYLTYDPTPATPFYDWDNEWREDAALAFDIGATYTEFPTPTDSHQFFNEDGGGNAAFGQGLPAEDVWAVSSRIVMARGGARYVLRLLRGFDQPTGTPEGGSRDFFELHGKATVGRHLVSGYFKKDAWGDQDFYRQFNITYPEQYKIDYAYLLGDRVRFTDRVSETRSSRIGLRMIYRTFDANSLEEEYQDGRNDWGFMTVAYFTYRF